MRNLICKPTSVRYNLLNDIDSLFNDRFFTDSLPAREQRQRSVFSEKDETYQAAFNLPGITKEAVTVSVVEDTLRVIAKSEEQAAFKVDYDATFDLPEDADPGKLSATLENGVLSIDVLKVEKVEPEERVIAIQ